MVNDFESRYRAVSSRDSRFDGWFVTAVTSTHIYCRPSCPAATPKPVNVRFYRTAAAAQAAGFRACRRCRPEAAPGSPEWNVRHDVVARAVRGIADGVVDRGGVAALASRLAVTPRHLHRMLSAELGAGPIALARAQRAHSARLLIETTDLTFADVAFAAGFASVRQFNETMRDVFAMTPTALRGMRPRAVTAVASGAIELRLPLRQPADIGGVLRFLSDRAIDGVEWGTEAIYRRSLRLPHGAGIVELRDGGGHVACTLRLEQMRDLGVAVARCRRLLDLDADPIAVDDHLSGDRILGPLVRASPGRRVPGAVDGTEMALRAIVGQQVSVAGARTVIARIVAAAAVESPFADTAISHIFPDADQLLALEPSTFAMPRARYQAIRGLLQAVVAGQITLQPTADIEAETAFMLAIPGVGPWTVAYIAMRALGDPDAFLATDLGVRHALERLGHASDARSVMLVADRWRPWRAYALQHLWNSLPPIPVPSRTQLQHRRSRSS